MTQHIGDILFDVLPEFYVKAAIAARTFLSEIKSSTDSLSKTTMLLSYCNMFDDLGDMTNLQGSAKPQCKHD